MTIDDLDLSVPNTITLTESDVQALPGFEALGGGPYHDTGDKFLSIGVQVPEDIKYWPLVELPPSWRCLGFVTNYGEYLAHIKPNRPAQPPA